MARGVCERRGLEGGIGVTSGDGAGTSGGAGVTSGMPPARKRAVAIAAVLALGALQTVANIASKIADRRSDGLAVDSGSLVLDEVTSLISWFICLAVIWQLVKWVRPPRFGWPATLALQALATVPVSLIHVALMVLFREFGHALAGSSYHFTNNWTASLIYEYRKDSLSYILLASICASIQWWTRAQVPVAADREEEFLEVGEGARIDRLSLREILWVEAAGNYVTLHLAGRSLLHRTTLAALEATLAPHGFVRIHRSRLVRSDAVRAIATAQSGDFSVTLEDGTELRGSRRFRKAVRDRVGHRS